jgi:hypothetical protein
MLDPAPAPARKRIPPPPVRSFAPDSPAPLRLRPPARQLAYAGDTREAPGNLSARQRRAGTPRSHAEWRRLMAAPTGR